MKLEPARALHVEIDKDDQVLVRVVVGVPVELLEESGRFLVGEVVHVTLCKRLELPLDEGNVAVEGSDHGRDDLLRLDVRVVATDVLLEESLDLGDRHFLLALPVKQLEDHLDAIVDNLGAVERLDGLHELVVAEAVLLLERAGVRLEPLVSAGVARAERVLEQAQLDVVVLEQLVELLLLLLHHRRKLVEVNVVRVAREVEETCELGSLSILEMELALSLLDEVLLAIGRHTLLVLWEEWSEDLLNASALGIECAADAVHVVLKVQWHLDADLARHGPTSSLHRWRLVGLQWVLHLVYLVGSHSRLHL